MWSADNFKNNLFYFVLTLHLLCKRDKPSVIHELLSRSMDGSDDAGISLNGDNTCNLDRGNYIQN